MPCAMSMPQPMQCEKAISSDVPRYDSAARIVRDGVHRVGAQRDRADEHVAVGHGDHAEVLLAAGLAAGGELGHGPAEGRFRRLAARVRVDLGVQHQDVHVAAGGEHVVQAAEADVVGPAVAAEAPDALADQVVGRGQQILGVGAVDGRQPLVQLGHQRARCAAISSSVSCLLFISAATSSSPNCAGQPLEQLVGVLDLLIDGQAEAEAELGAVLEQRVRPGRAAALVVDRVGRAGQVAAVDRRAARGVADQHPVAEELRDELDVGRFAAAGAGPGELEQRQQAAASP